LSLSPSRPEFLPTGQGLAAREIAVDLALVRPAHENTLPHRAHIGQGFLYVKVDTGVVLNFPDWKSTPNMSARCKPTATGMTVLRRGSESDPTPDQPDT
jgi:hypothetical protein